MSSRRQLARVLAVLCMAVALPGCASLPDDGAVQRVAPMNSQQEPALIEFRPDGPLKGDTAQQVVEGFLAAMQAYPPSSLVARRFLTPAAAARWHPEASTRIYTEHASGATGGGTVSLRSRVVGTLSAQGSWTSAPYGGRAYRRDLRLVRLHGQWRIANPSPGTLVSQSYFERYYRPYAIYFFDRSRTVVVPDLRYLPEGAQTPTLLVQALLRGPTSTLAPAVGTLVPVSTEVSVSVPVNEAGVADVALSRDVLALGGSERQLLLAQVVWTLRQVSGITGVRVSAGGAGLEIPGAAAVAPIDTLPGFDPAGFAAARRLFGLNGDRLVTVNGSEITPVDGPLGRGRVPADSFAVDLQGRRAAVVSAGRDSVLVGGISAADTGAALPPVEWYAGGRGLLRPSWDRTGRLWLVDRPQGRARIVVVSDGEPTRVHVGGLTGEDVRALRLSRDGVHLAAVVGHGRDARLVVGVVVRSADGTVRDVVQVRRVSNPMLRLHGIADVGWTSPTSLAVLARVRGETPQPFVVALDGSSVTQSSALPDIGVSAVAAAANADVPVVVGTRSGRLWIRRADLRWTRLAGDSRISSPAYPG